MEQRIEIDGNPVVLTTTAAEHTFRTEILALTDVNRAFQESLLARGIAWARTMNAAHEDAAVHCFRNEGAIVLEGTGFVPDANQLLEMSVFLQGRMNSRAARTAGTEGTAAADSRGPDATWPLRRHSLPARDRDTVGEDILQPAASG